MNQICEAYGCEEKATKQIKLDAGKLGTVTLFVCTNCVAKFQDVTKQKVGARLPAEPRTTTAVNRRL